MSALGKTCLPAQIHIVDVREASILIHPVDNRPYAIVTVRRPLDLLSPVALGNHPAKLRDHPVLDQFEFIHGVFSRLRFHLTSARRGVDRELNAKCRCVRRHTL